MSRLTGTLAAAVTFPLVANLSAWAQNDPWAEVLAKVNLTPGQVTFDYADMSNYGGDEFVLPLFEVYHRHPFRMPYYVDFHANYLMDNWRDLSGVVGFCSQRIDEGSRRGLIGNPLDAVRARADSMDLRTALGALTKAAKGLVAPPSLPSDMEPGMERVLKVLVLAVADVYAQRQLAFEPPAGGWNPDSVYTKALRLGSYTNDSYDTELYEFIHWPRWKYLHAGAQDLMRAVRWAADSMVSVSKPIQIPTPLGRIVVGTQADDEYPPEDYLIILDPGGNDRYHGGAANRSYANPISILIDVSGNDVYDASSDSLLPSFGAGVFGYACLIDRAGDDSYHGVMHSQGAGLFGVGCLVDESGRDHYVSHANSQGSGTFGIGVLIDSAGKDLYESYLSSQGYGFTKGMGLLLDIDGDDEYISNDVDIRYPSSQTKEHNDALSQGVGFGMRRDYIDGYSLAGGVGYLVDGAGDDTYSAGLFAQGCAYWYAIGVLWDRAGDDCYFGTWYVQGSGAHFGVGFLNDKAGDDRYTAGMNMAQGAGHDFTVGYLLDEAGNDHHIAPNLSLGGGNANGIGLFWDKAGDDVYEVTAATTLGRANTASRGSLRDSILTLGVFLDTGGGKDTYPSDKPFAQNDTVWTQRGTDTTSVLNSEKGCGGDF
ncbi:MAG: hypothetical protein AB1752_07770 [Candidatus Zixiibacteriota bacterium]